MKDRANQPGHTWFMGCFLRGDAPSLRTDIGRGKAGDILGKVRRCKGSKGAFGKLSVGSIWWHSDSVRRDVAMMVGRWDLLEIWIDHLVGWVFGWWRFANFTIVAMSVSNGWFPIWYIALCLFEAFMVRLSQSVFKTSMLWHGYLVSSWWFQRILEILYIVKLDHLPR